MLPLLVLAGLVGAGVIISRSEQAEEVQAPRPQKCDQVPRDGKAAAPYRPDQSKSAPTQDDLRAQKERRGMPANAERLPAGPFGTGPLAHFSDYQVGNIQQSPALLARTTGSPDPASVPGGKREVPTNGMPEANRLTQSRTIALDTQRERMHLTNMRHGIKPFYADQERAMGEDDDRIRYAATPPTIDQLRGANNQRTVAKGRIAGAPLRTQLRGEPGQVCNMPRMGDKCGDTRFGAGKAAVHRGANDGQYLVPYTCREGMPGTMGGAGRSMGDGHTVAQTTLRNTSPGGLCGTEGFVSGGSKARDRDADVDTYAGALCPPERGSLPEVPLGGAHASAMGQSGPLDSRSSASVEDMSASDGRLAANRKALLSQTPRAYGALQIASNPPKQTVHEPEPLRTTLRETSIHDTHEGHLKGIRSPGETRSPDAHARITGRETLPDTQGAAGDGRLDGTVSLTKAPVYDPDDIFRTTTKETTEVNRHMGQVGTMEHMQGPAADPNVDPTQRGVDAERSEYYGIAERPDGDGYLTTDASLVGTNREIKPQTDYRGGAGPATVPRTPADDRTLYTRAIGDSKERILRRRSPNGRRETLTPGAQEIGRGTNNLRDPCMDEQKPRLTFQHQGRVQMTQIPECAAETKAGRRVIERSPDTFLLTQLQDNPYALPRKGVGASR